MLERTIQAAAPRTNPDEQMSLLEEKFGAASISNMAAIGLKAACEAGTLFRELLQSRKSLEMGIEVYHNSSGVTGTLVSHDGKTGFVQVGAEPANIDKRPLEELRSPVLTALVFRKLWLESHPNEAAQPVLLTAVATDSAGAKDEVRTCDPAFPRQTMTELKGVEFQIARYVMGAEKLTMTEAWKFNVQSTRGGRVNFYDPALEFFADPPVDSAFSSNRVLIVAPNTGFQAARQAATPLLADGGRFSTCSSTGAFWSSFFDAESFLDSTARTIPSVIVTTGTIRNHPYAGGETLSNGVFGRLEDIARRWRIDLRRVE